MSVYIKNFLICIKKSHYKTKTYFTIFHSKKKKPNRNRHEKDKSIPIRFNNRHCQTPDAVYKIYMKKKNRKDKLT